MPRKNSYITATDQFCGAGGSSQGAVAAGVEVKLALNHWKLAIETHNTNFPKTQHDCTDISACDPRRYPSTDILITSPECTNHSLAKGQKIVKKQMDLFEKGIIDPAAERSRATMWDVCRFAEYHNYNAIIVENVVDARKWLMFDAWLQAMYALGYLHRCVYLNSMHCHPTPQSRDRMYVVFWKKGNKAPQLDYMPLAHCPKCGKDVHSVQTWKRPDVKFGKYRQQYVYCCPNDGTVVEPYYYAAFNCIDWSNIGQRIGDRKKPLSSNTINRIEYGLKKYAGEPIIVNDQHSTGLGFRVRSTKDRVDTITTTPHFKMVMPFIIKLEHSQRMDNSKSVADEFATQTNRQSQMMITNVRSSKEALQTQTTTQGMGIVSPAFIVENKKQSKTRGIDKSLSCITTKPYHGIITTEAFNSFINYNRKQFPTHITEPVQTVATVEQNSVISYKEPSLEDCYYRMLTAAEVKLAMAFGGNYIVLGNSKDQVKQLGNAVTPPAMQWLTKQVVESLK